MIYQASPIAVIIFLCFVAFVLGLSFYFSRKSKSSSAYFAAGGNIHWGVNGIAFAGDYLSAASFLGICGMIATAGYDGFLYSIGYLAGWIVALFVVAEPLKRLGKFTFADALDAKFNSKKIQLMAAISTLVVSIFYLIPQMVGAGALVTPLLGLPHYAGVIMVGAVVIFIVATAGMTSTTYVQFLKGALLIIFSLVLTVTLIRNGVNSKPENSHIFQTLELTSAEPSNIVPVDTAYKTVLETSAGDIQFVKVEKNGIARWWMLKENKLIEILSKVTDSSGKVLYNGEPKENEKFYQVGHVEKIVHNGKVVEKTGPLGPFAFLSTINNSTVTRYKEVKFKVGGESIQAWVQNPTEGKKLMRPGMKFKIEGVSWIKKLDFVSLMIALFFGTAALPHILIRYYTVKSQKDARKSTIVAICAIGIFYILTLYMGLGAMVNGVLDVENSNMAAPLLAKTFGIALFSIISAIAFATVLGTVSGLIVAASGTVAHDLMDHFFEIKMSDKQKVMAGKTTAVTVGIIAIMLGILFEKMNVSFLVGWAFAFAASANLPAILMLLFWKKTTDKGIAASIAMGMISALAIILLSPSMFEQYGLLRESAPMPIDNPGIVSIPVSFLTLIVVSLLTQKKETTTK